STEQVAAFCRSLHDMSGGGAAECVSPAWPSPDSPLSSPLSPPAAPSGPAAPSSSSSSSSGPRLQLLSDADKLRKVICELVETERTYVKDLNSLIGRYLTPLQKETFLTQDELDVLFGNLPEMVEFQVEFLKTLEDGTRLVPDLENLERVEQFKTDADFKAFLDERNPRQQHSSTLESYLIKPIQRVLKYPLLLRELHALTDPESEEHYHLDVAMKAMNKVASHINDMQKIHEEFGAVFDQLITEQTGDRKEVADLSMGDLLLHATVAWLNPPSSLGKWKKEPQLATFVFKTAVVFVCKDGSKQKKKLGSSHRVSMSSEEKDPFRFRHMISTETLQIRALANGDGEGSAVCEIVHIKSESEGRPERSFQLCCSSPESRVDFLKAVHSILREKQRRQLLKTESLPLSQQYVPFGGKRLCALKGARPAINRAVSVPTRTLGRRKLVRNRFTIDTDIVFDREPDLDPGPPAETPQDPPGEAEGEGGGETEEEEGVAGVAGDTDRWVEEQFDLEEYEDREEVKETDILSDEEELSLAGRPPAPQADLEEPVMALTLGGGEEEEEKQQRGEEEKQEVEEEEAGAGGPRRRPQMGKQGAVCGEMGEGEVWVRRKRSDCSSDCDT
ncbi:hypothetical protein CRUP_014562, partial [Coryphaenoides rupestris]